MSTCSTAKRRRSQARKNYRHLPPQVRPHFLRRDIETSARRLTRAIENERRMKSGKKG